jgi:hypothetical protein
VAWLLFNGYSVSTIGSNFSQVVFKFQVSPELLWSGLKWALGIGLVGGLFPALRAARLPSPPPCARCERQRGGPAQKPNAGQRSRDVMKCGSSPPHGPVR